MPLLKIVCPCCGYGKEIGSESIPANTTHVTCPQCTQKFPFPTTEIANPAAIGKPDSDEILPDYISVQREKPLYEVIYSAFRAKVTMKNAGLGCGVLILVVCFVGRPHVVVLPELSGKIEERNPVFSTDSGGQRLSRNAPVRNAPVFVFSEIRRPVLLPFGDGSSQPTIASTGIRYYTYTDDRGNISIPGTLLIKPVFGTLLHRFYLDEVRVVVLSKTQDGHLVDSGVSSPKPYNVYTSKEQKYFDAINAPDVKPLTWSDRVRHRKEAGHKNWWERFKAWIWGKEWQIS
jgi:hypothetical protein